MNPIIKRILNFKKSEIPEYEKHLMLAGGSPGPVAFRPHSRNPCYPPMRSIRPAQDSRRGSGWLEMSPILRVCGRVRLFPGR